MQISSKLMDLENQAEALQAEEDFNKALDSADSNCSGCPTCSPNYLIEVPLEKAVKAEKLAEPLLGAAEYNRLATLGSSVWDVSRTAAFIEKALARSASPLDRYFSHLVLGHVYFCHLEKGVELSKLDAARKEFKLAVSFLQTENTNDGTRIRIGQCYAIWAAHEAYLHNTSESDQAWANATTSWSKLPTEAEFTLQLHKSLAFQTCLTGYSR